MTTEITQRMQNQLDSVVQVLPDEEVEFWFARDLQEPLGYARWENFMTAIRRAIESCETMGYSPDDHFRGVTKMVRLGSGAERAIDDFMLTRYACYLIAMNGDPRKEPIAFAQSYFASHRVRRSRRAQQRVGWVSRRRNPPLAIRMDGFVTRISLIFRQIAHWRGRAVGYAAKARLTHPTQTTPQSRMQPCSSGLQLIDQYLHVAV